MLFLRQLDLVLLGLTLPLFLVADLPMLGWATGAGVWLAQRAIQALATRKASASEDTRTTVGVMVASMIGRGWLMAGVIFAVGVNHNSDGLAAALLVIALVTVHFMMSMVMRPLQGPEPKAAKGPAAKTGELPR